jgi:hypothetical protein
MAKREQARARADDKSWRGGKVPGVLRAATVTQARRRPLENVFTINALYE